MKSKESGHKRKGFDASLDGRLHTHTWIVFPPVKRCGKTTYGPRGRWRKTLDSKRESKRESCVTPFYWSFHGHQVASQAAWLFFLPCFPMCSIWWLALALFRACVTIEQDGNVSFQMALLWPVSCQA